MRRNELVFGLVMALPLWLGAVLPDGVTLGMSRSHLVAMPDAPRTCGHQGDPDGTEDLCSAIVFGGVRGWERLTFRDDVLTLVVVRFPVAPASAVTAIRDDLTSGMGEPSQKETLPWSYVLSWPSVEVRVERVMKVKRLPFRIILGDDYDVTIYFNGQPT